MLACLKNTASVTRCALMGEEVHSEFTCGGMIENGAAKAGCVFVGFRYVKADVHSVG